MKTNTLNTIYKLICLTLLASPAITWASPPEWAMTGKAAEVTGELEVLYFDDFENHRGSKKYFIHDKNQGKRFELEFEGKPPKDATTGSFARVRGQAQDEQIYLATDDPSSFEPLATTPAAAMVSGDQATIVMMTNLNDASVPCSTQEIKETIFEDPNQQSVNDLYRETSLNNIQITGIVAGPFTINYSSTGSCDIHAWAQAADDQATANGINLTQYKHKVYILPKQNSCGWYGAATLGGSPSKAWITQCDMKDTIAHELGHNFGMGHAGTPTGSYSDTSDIMGYSGGNILRQINGPHQEQMGWRDPQQVIEITTDGIYDIAPLELNTNIAAAPQLLKILKPDTGEWYYLSYRQALGFDQSLFSGYLSGVSIHQHAGNGSTSKTVWIDTLINDENFTDTVNGVAITQTSHNADTVSIEVTFANTCSRHAPTVNLTPPSQTDIAGSTLSYAVTITNNDTANCSDSSWELSTQKPAEWSDSLTSSDAMTANIISITPGSSASVNWQVTSVNTAGDNNYALALNMLSTYTAIHDASLAANYTVTTPSDTQPPSVPTDLSATVQRKKIVVGWQASSDNIAVVGYNIFRNNIHIATSPSTSYNDSNLTSGETYIYHAVAFDAVNNLSLPSNTNSVTFGNGGGGNKGGGKKR